MKAIPLPVSEITILKNFNQNVTDDLADRKVNPPLSWVTKIRKQ